MLKMCREFARCEGLTHMGLGMLIGGAFLHLVFAATSQFVLPFFRLSFPGTAAGKNPALMCFVRRGNAW